LETLPLLDDNGDEIQIFSSTGMRIHRMRRRNDPSREPSCGVLVNLTKIQSLFNQGPQVIPDNEFIDGSVPPPSTSTRVYAYPLCFLHTAGNLKANGIPHCFYPVITQINRRLRNLPGPEYDPDNEDDQDVDYNLHLDDLSPDPIVVPVSSQFYNYITHRTAMRSGGQDAQQGSITSALAGTFAESTKDKRIAKQKLDFCDTDLPSTRFHKKISGIDCPICTRAEFVYAIDVQKIKSPSGM
jgi:hypothetical protein